MTSNDSGSSPVDVVRSGAFYQADPVVFQLLQIEIFAEARQDGSQLTLAAQRSSSILQHPQASSSTHLTVGDTASQQGKRPRSADFGGFAKDRIASARMSLFRLGNRTRSDTLERSEQSNGSEINTAVGPGNRTVRQVSLLLPQVAATMRGAIPLDISSRSEMRSKESVNKDDQWTHLKAGKASFTSDPEVASPARSGIKITRSPSEASQSSVIIHDVVKPDGTASNGKNSTGLPLIFFPLQGAGVEKALSMSFVIRQAARPLGNPASPTKATSSSRINLRGPRPLQGSSSSKEIASPSQTSDVTFVAAASMTRLLDAVKSTKADNGQMQGSLSSQAAAKLEGLFYIKVVREHSEERRDADSFEWQCSSQALSTWRRFGEKPEKVACAFVQLDRCSGELKVLSSLQFVVHGGDMSPSHMVDAKTRPFSPVSSRRVPSPNDTGSMYSARASPLPPVSDDNHSPTKDGYSTLERTPRPQDRVHRSASTPAKSYSVDIESMSKLDQIELELQDAEMDSPVFRAALSTLEKRTAKIKECASGLRKAAGDCVASLEAAIEADGRLEDALTTSCSWTPATYNLLLEKHLLEKRKQIKELREQESRLLVVHVVAPMEALEEKCRELLEILKSFDGDSQAFYSATQKWLSLKGKEREAVHSDVLTSSSEGEGSLSSAGKLQRENDKQKLRQACYDLLRIQLFQSATTLHGGDAELKLAIHYLSLARWHAAAGTGLHGGEEESKALSDLEAIMKMHGTKVQAKLWATNKKCSELTSLIESLEARLDNRSLDAIEWRQRPAQSEIDLASAARNAGKRTKIKTLLSHLSSKGSSSSVAKTRRFSGLSPLSRADKADLAQAGPVDWSALPVSSYANENGRGEGEPCISAPAIEHAMTQPSRAGLPDRRPSAPIGTMQSSGQLSSAARREGSLASIAPHPLERKKEGVLWVLSKDVSTVDDSDASRQASKGSKWHESWVVLSGSGHLGEYSGWKDTKSMKLEATQPLIDLRFATTREARGLERRFVFEVITRESRRLYQASSEKEMRGWLGAIRFAIECLLNGTSSVRQVEKVAKASVFSAGLASRGGDFGAGTLLDMATSSPLTMHKAFSQSMTDLGFAQGLTAKGIAQKRKSKVQDVVKPEAPATSLVKTSHSRGSSMQVPWRKSENTTRDTFFPLDNRNVGHARGISNATPVSGYIASYDPRMPFKMPQTSAERLARHSSKRHQDRRQSEADRKIEEAVERHFGAPSGTQVSTKEGSGSDTESSSSPSEAEKAQRTPSNASTRLASGTLLRADTLHRRYVSTGSCFAPTKFGRAQEIQGIARQPCNSTCGDCGRANPRWASWAIHGQACCIFVCIACSGIHRSLGVDVCKVKSVDLGDWNEEQLQAARNWGNERVNAFFEATKPPGLTVETLGGTRTRQFWKQKYIERAWYRDVSATISVHRNVSARSRPPLLVFDQPDSGKSDENVGASAVTSKIGPVAFSQDSNMSRPRMRRPLSTLS